MKLLARVHALLDAKRVTHALIGAAAMAVRGVSRSTLDLDFLTTDRLCLDPRTWAELSAEGAAVEVREGDVEDPLAGVARVQRAGDRPVDIVVGHPGWQEEILRRALSQKIGGVEIPVVLASDLVLLKLFAGGKQDRWDIEQLLAGPDREQLIDDVRREIVRLPSRCRKMWKEITKG